MKDAAQETGTHLCDENLLAAAIAQRTDRGAQRRRLLQHVLDVVADPLMHASIPGRAVDLVVYQGKPESRLEKILQTIDRRRRARKIRTSTGALFRHLVMQWYAEEGIAWKKSE
jgi:hypothetical protein